MGEQFEPWAVYPGRMPTENFWSITAPKLSDVSVAALVAALDRAPDELPPGVFRASFEHLHDSRFAWAAEYIMAELLAAPGVTIDQRAGLGVVWSEIGLRPVANPNMARPRARKIVELGASFVPALLERIKATLAANTAQAFEEAAKASGRRQSIPPAKMKPRGDPFEAPLARAKKLERQLRAQFDVEDLGERASMADRRAVVGIMSTGATSTQLLEALRGRAAWCGRQRWWDTTDTAEAYLRITWICATARRFEEMLTMAPSQPPEPGRVVKTEHGTFVGGRQIFE